MLLSTEYLQRVYPALNLAESDNPDTANIYRDPESGKLMQWTIEGNKEVPDPIPKLATDDQAFNFVWGGRYENPNPFDTAQVKQAALGLAQMLGKDVKIAYEAAAEFANNHFNQFRQFYTEASSPEVIWDGIKAGIFARAGVTEPDSEKLRPDQIAYYGNIAQSRQEDFKALDKRNAEVDAFTSVSLLGKAVGWVTGPIGSAAIKLAEYSNKPDSPYATPVQKFEKLKPFNSNPSLLNPNRSSSVSSSDPTNFGRAKRLIAAASVLESPIGLSVIGIALLLLIGFVISRR